MIYDVGWFACASVQTFGPSFNRYMISAWTGYVKTSNLEGPLYP
jgi:hypothetical protein